MPVYVDLNVEEYVKLKPTLFHSCGALHKGVYVDGSVAYPEFRVCFNEFDDCVAAEELLGWSKEEGNRRRKYC